MGTWQLEIVRMAIYIAFPVTLFHWFNQPENFEDWVIKTRREFFPPDDKENEAHWAQFIQEFNAEKDMDTLLAMEKKQKELDARISSNKAL